MLETMLTSQKLRHYKRQRSEAQKAIELSSRRFQKEMDIKIRKEHLQVIVNSSTRLLNSVFDKRSFERKKRRCVTRDSRVV